MAKVCVKCGETRPDEDFKVDKWYRVSKSCGFCHQRKKGGPHPLTGTGELQKLMFEILGI